MAITVDVSDACANGHGKVTFTTGVKSWTFNFNKSEILDLMSDEELEIAVKTILRFLKVASNSTTWAQMKTNFTNREVSL